MARSEQEAEGSAAADAALFVEVALLGQDQAAGTLLLLLLLQFTTRTQREGRREGEG